MQHFPGGVGVGWGDKCKGAALTYYFGHFSQKTHEIEEKLDRKGEGEGGWSRP